MSTLSVWRQRARALLPGACFLRRDQQLRALFVTDFPRRQPENAETALSHLQAAGFAVTESKGLWLLDLSAEAQVEFIRSLPTPTIRDDLPLEIRSLCRSLMAGGPQDADKQPWEAIKLVLARLEVKEIHLLIPELRALTAQYKRQKTPLPTAIVSLLNEEGSSC